jgi:hypothetical protein
MRISFVPNFKRIWRRGCADTAGARTVRRPHGKPWRRSLRRPVCRRCPGACCGSMGGRWRM